jgi:hypothetical protein
MLGVYKMKTSNLKCNNCGITLKEDVDYKYSIVGKYSKKN